jgi:hypothetical protein
MRIIDLTTIDEDLLLSSNIAASSEDEYDDSTTYATDNLVKVSYASDGTTARRPVEIYKSLSDSNTGNYPPDSPSYWSFQEATDRWKMFDGYINTQSENADSIEVELDVSDKTALAIFNTYGIEAKLEHLVTHWALSFGNVDDRVEFPSSISFSSSEPWTVEHWIKWTDNTPPDWVFYGGALENDNSFFIKRINVDGEFGFRNNLGSYFTSGIDSTQYKNIFVFLSWVADGFGNISLYINGSLAASGSIDTATVFNVIGKSYTSTNYNFVGQIYGWRIWNTARTQQQIQDNMDITLTGSEAGLVAYYPVAEGAGSTLYDYAGPNDGTIYGATWEVESEDTFTQTVDLLRDSIKDWWDYYFAPSRPGRDIVFYFPRETSDEATLTISYADGTAKCGLCVVGEYISLAKTKYGVTVGIDDYSIYETDETGQIYLDEGDYAKRSTLEAHLYNTDIDSAYRAIVRNRGQATVFDYNNYQNPDDYHTSADKFQVLVIYGFTEDFEITLPGPIISQLDHEVQGMI